MLHRAPGCGAPDTSTLGGMPIRRLAKLITVSAGILGVAYVAKGFLEKKAYDDAQQMCSAIKPGMSTDQLQALAKSHGGRLSVVAKDAALALTSGGGLLCRCKVELKDNRATTAGSATCIY